MRGFLEVCPRMVALVSWARNRYKLASRPLVLFSFDLMAWHRDPSTQTKTKLFSWDKKLKKVKNKRPAGVFRRVCVFAILLGSLYHSNKSKMKGIRRGRKEKSWLLSPLQNKKKKRKLKKLKKVLKNVGLSLVLGDVLHSRSRLKYPFPLWVLQCPTSCDSTLVFTIQLLSEIQRRMEQLNDEFN